MKKLLAIVLCLACMCTMLAGVNVSAAETTSATKYLVGKQVTGIDSDNWTISSNGSVAQNKLYAASGNNTSSAQTKNTYTLGENYTFEFTLQFTNDCNNFYDEYVAVKLGTNQLRVRNITTYSADSAKNYGVELYNGSTLVASAYLGGTASSVDGQYTFSYKNGVFSGTVNGSAINWAVGNSTANQVTVALAAIEDAYFGASVANNYGTTTRRYISDLKIRGSANGDNNYDGEVNSADLLLAKQSMLGIADESGNCDSNYDDTLTVADILSLSQHLLGNGWLEGYEPDPINIMCIGDSITEGVGTLSGWRASFFEQLYAEGVYFNMVGSYTTKHDFRLPEGYRGFSAVGGYSTKNILDKMPTYVKNDFDVVAIMIGYNDRLQWSASKSIEYYHGILDAIYEKNPDAYVYVSTMCPDGQHLDNNCVDWENETINPLLPEMVAEYEKLGYNIKLINNIHYGWTAADFPSTDHIHPTEKGRAKIAAAFCDGMKADMRNLNNSSSASFAYEPKMNVITDLALAENNVTIETGMAKTVATAITPANAPIQNILWSSSNESVASVNIDGRITAVAEGTATITAKTLDGGIEKTVTVTVTKNTQSSSTKVFNETFENLNNWSLSDSTSLSISGGALSANYPQSNETATTKSSYSFNNGFELSFDYRAYGNEGEVWSNSYGAIKYAGVELRCGNAGRQFVLVDANGTVLGSYTTVVTIDYVNCRLVYKNGTLTAYYNNEPVIVVNDVTLSNASSTVTYVQNQRYRAVSIDNIYIGSY